MKAKNKSLNNRKLRESTVTRLIQQEMLNNAFRLKETSIREKTKSPQRNKEFYK